MAERRVKWPGRGLGRRLRARAGAAVEGAVYGSSLYRLSLRGRRPDALRFAPSDPMPGDADRGRALIGGDYDFGGERVTSDHGVPWRNERVGQSWLVEAHGFGWLRDLAAVGGAEARSAARAALGDWIANCGVWRPIAWRPDVLGRRIVAWLSHASLLLGDDNALAALARASLAEQLRHLGRTAANAADGEARIAALMGLVTGGLALDGGERRLARGLQLLDQEIARQVLTDGGHVERSPSAHLAAFLDLASIRATLVASQTPVPDTLQGAIDRMAPMLRFFRHGDGGLALFNDSNEESPTAIDIALGLGEATGAAPKSAPHTGFERIAARHSLLIVDVGGPPPAASRHSHAGPLSFEFSVGAERLIVNCGAHGGDRPEWREAQRATAAHSTVTVDDTNAFETVPDGAPAARRVATACTRNEDDGNTWLEARHDGYQAAFGLSHARRLYLDTEGTDLRGEDCLSGPGGTGFTVRFHLHPDVSVSLVGEGAGALLRLPDGAGWRLRAAGAAMRIAESVYLGRRNVVRRSEQIVLSGPLTGGTTIVKWALSRIARVS